ncbi:MAG: type II toxin-antitoxin system HicB family antitoxin [Geminicoccaceae bacterium]
MSEVDRYPLTVRPLDPDEGGGYLCAFPDLPGCMGDGATPEEAIADGKEALRASLEALREFGRSCHLPARQVASGGFTRRNPCTAAS